MTKDVSFIYFWSKRQSTCESLSSHNLTFYSHFLDLTTDSLFEHVINILHMSRVLLLIEVFSPMFKMVNTR